MSTERADIRSIVVIDSFRSTLDGFVDSGRAALMQAESDLEKTNMSHERQRVSHWNRQIRRPQALLTRAKSELYRKQMQSSAKEGRVGDSDERMNLQRAERNLQDAYLYSMRPCSSSASKSFLKIENRLNIKKIMAT